MPSDKVIIERDGPPTLIRGGGWCTITLNEDPAYAGVRFMATIDDLKDPTLPACMLTADELEISAEALMEAASAQRAREAANRAARP